MAAWFKDLAVRRPYLYAVQIVFCFFLFGAPGVAVGSWISGTPLTAAVPQTAGKYVGGLLMILLLWRMGQLAEIGVSRPFRPPVCLISLAAAVYLMAAATFAFFGRPILTLPDTAAARDVLISQIGTGLIEESAFRGVMLAGLLLAWGRGRRGAFKASLVSAICFGLLHLIYLGSEAVEVVILNTAAAVTGGFWYAVLVWRFRAFWPVVLFHAAVNAIVLANSPHQITVDYAYWRLLAADLLPLLLALYWLRTAAEEGQGRAAAPADLSPAD